MQRVKLNNNKIIYSAVDGTKFGSLAEALEYEACLEWKWVDELTNEKVNSKTYQSKKEITMRTMTTELMLNMLKCLISLDKGYTYSFAAKDFKVSKRYNRQHVKEELLKWLSVKGR